MMNLSLHSEVQWWQAILQIAHFVHTRPWLSYDSPLEETELRKDLGEKGFNEEVIEKALSWLQNACLTSSLADIFGMLEPSSCGVRITHPLETLFVSDSIWRQLERYRKNGYISNELSERILEGIRVLDTRDWEDEEVVSFISDVVAIVRPAWFEKFFEKGFTKLAARKNHGFYC